MDPNGTNLSPETEPKTDEEGAVQRNLTGSQPATGDAAMLFCGGLPAWCEDGAMPQVQRIVGTNSVSDTIRTGQHTGIRRFVMDRQLDE